MSSAHCIRTIDCNEVQSLDCMVWMEVEPGTYQPYKNNNLLQEVLSMWLPPTQDRVLGNTFIDGAHMVLTGLARRQLHLLYQNSEVNEQFVSNFSEYLCTHIYQYLCKEKHFTCRCSQTKPNREV